MSDNAKEIERKRAILGRSPIFTPEVMNDIHMKAELGRYRMRGFSMFKPIPHWDQLMFMPGTLTRFVIEGYREKCVTKTVLGARFAKKPMELDIPIYITGMSFGALSLEAKMALAKGASMAGTATCSGEGGLHWSVGTGECALDLAGEWDRELAFQGPADGAAGMAVQGDVGGVFVATLVVDGAPA